MSSGAVGVGLKRLNLENRPKHLAQVQAVAAVGQGRLMALYDELFGKYDIPIAQILLTRENLADVDLKTFSNIREPNILTLAARSRN